VGAANPEGNTMNGKKLTVLALYWWHRIKVRTLQIAAALTEKQCAKAENKMLELAKRYDW